jgi:hypothetical protein
MKKLNLKQPKYVLPLIALPFVLMIGYFYVQFTENSGKDKNKLAESKDISTDFGKVGERSEIKGKADAYADFFDKRTDGRTMIDGLVMSMKVLKNLMMIFQSDRKGILTV